jgi:DNA primase
MTIATDVKAKLDPAAIIGESVKLKRSGKTLVGSCPFHAHKAEKKSTPSFVVWPDTGTWRCFGACADGGDIYSFVMKRDGVEFAEALQTLAQHAGVELGQKSAQARAKEDYEDRLRALLAAAAARYAANLATQPAAPAKEHLAGRGLEDAAVQQFQIGYSRRDGEDIKALQALGYSNDDLRAAGLLAENESRTLYPRFRHRLMLPIRDERGRVVGFQARTLDGQEPKFLNSPQTALFSKGRVLYALDVAKNKIRREGVAVIVEGNLDAIAAHAAGFSNVVSSQGTAVTPEQMALIGRYAKRVVLALDGDTAGATATLAAMKTILETGGETEWRIATLPDGDDPDDVIKRDPTEWQTTVASGRPLASHIIHTLTAGQATTDAQARAAVAGAVAPYLAAVKNPVELATYRQELATALGIPLEALTAQEAPGATENATPAQDAAPAQNEEAAPPTESTGGEDFILAGLLKRAEEAKSEEEATKAVEQAIELLAKRSDVAVSRYAERFLKLGFARVAFERLIRAARSRQGGQSSLVTVEYGQLCWAREPLVNCNIRITEEQHAHDGNEQPTVLYTIEGILPNGEHLPPIRRLPAEEFEGGKWLSKWGTRVRCFKAPAQRWVLTSAIQEHSMSDVKRETVSNCTGWVTQNGVRMYLTNGGAITADGHNPDVKVDLGADQLLPYHLPPPPDDARKSVKAALGLLDVGPLSFTAPIWCATLAAVLNDQINPRGMLWVSGRTGSRKTTYVMLCMTLYGAGFIQGHETRPPANWASSIVALENLWYPTKDIPLVVDNYKPPSDRSEAMRQRKVVDDTLHLLGDGGGRARGKESGGLRKIKPPRGLVIATSELPFDGESNVRRMFTLVVSPTDINTERLTKYQALGESGLLAEAMAAYIQWRLKHWDKVSAIIRDEKTLRTGVARRVGLAEGRILDYAVVMMVSASLFLEFSIDVGAITSAQRSERYGAIEQSILKVAQQQQQRAEAQTPLQKFAEALQAGIETRVGLILPRTGAFVFDRGQKVFGYWEKDKAGHHLCLHMPSCIEFVTAHYAAIGQVFTGNSEVVGRDIDHAKLLLNRGERSISVSKYCAGNTVNVLDIDADLFARLTGVDLWPPRLGAEGGE